MGRSQGCRTSEDIKRSAVDMNSFRRELDPRWWLLELESECGRTKRESDGQWADGQTGWKGSRLVHCDIPNARVTERRLRSLREGPVRGPLELSSYNPAMSMPKRPGEGRRDAR